MDICGHWLPVGDEGQQGGSSNDQRDPGDGSSGGSSPLASALGSTFRPWPPTFWPIAVPMTEESNRLIDSVYVA